VVHPPGQGMKRLNYLGIIMLEAADVFVVAGLVTFTTADTSVVGPTIVGFGTSSVISLVEIASIVVVVVVVIFELGDEFELSTLREILALIQATASGILGSYACELCSSFTIGCPSQIRSPGLQMTKDLEFSVPGKTSSRFGSPNVTMAAIRGNRAGGKRPAARCITCAP